MKDNLNPTPTPQRLLSVVQAAKYLAISERTLWTLIKENRLPAVRFSDRITRIDTDDLERFIQSVKGAAR